MLRRKFRAEDHFVSWRNKTRNIKSTFEKDPDFRTDLKKAGYLTRDSRVKERKKVGLKKARKASIFKKDNFLCLNTKKYLHILFKYNLVKVFK